MSNSTSKIKLVSNDFAKMVRTVLKAECTVDAETGDRACISRPALVQLMLKQNKKALPSKNERVLIALVEAAEQAGQLEGYESRRGRDGGIFKSEEKVRKTRKPRAPKVAVETAPEAPEPTVDAESTDDQPAEVKAA